MRPAAPFFSQRNRLSFQFFLLFVFVLSSKLSGQNTNIVIDDQSAAPTQKIELNNYQQIIQDNDSQHKINLTDIISQQPQDTNDDNKDPSPSQDDPETIPLSSKEETVPPSDGMFFFYLFGTAGLVCGAGLFSGLTLGVLSLDHTTLLVLSNSGPADQRRYAQQVLPLLKEHHHVLVTLLISNAAAAETMPIFLEQLVPPTVAVAMSVFLLLVFGEIIPQAICSRYGLMIGAKMTWFLKFLMFITYPLSKPIAMFLDYLLGEHQATFFRRAELSTLIGLHAEAGHGGNEEPLTGDEVAIIKGALEMSAKNVKQAMVPLKSVFMLSQDEVLDTSTLERIARKGHSRIPVFQGKRTNIIGLLLVKNLIQYTASDKVAVSQIATKEVMRLTTQTAMFDALNEFQSGRSHLAIVEENGEPVGIITLEDLIEELLQEEIEDEKDRTRKMKIGLMQLLSRSSVSFSFEPSREGLGQSVDGGAIQMRHIPRKSRTPTRSATENESQPLIDQ